MLQDSAKPEQVWEEACKCAQDIYNKIPRRRAPTDANEERLSPEQAFHKNKTPSLKHLTPFGTNVVIHVPKAKKDGKCRADKGQQRIMVGYEENYIHKISLLQA